MTPITRLRYVPLLLGLALPLATSGFVLADDAPPHHHQPPQAAFDACQQKKQATPAPSPSTSTRSTASARPRPTTSCSAGRTIRRVRPPS